MIKIENGCALEWLKLQPDFSADIIYCDPPYLLGSEIIIRPDGKPDYKKPKDFMNAWRGLDGAFWEQFYKEANRVLKHGGHLLMFGIDRQLFLFGYYSNLAGFETKQSLYWYFISNFPKASDLSKMIAKNEGLLKPTTGTLFNNPNAKRDLSKRSDYGYKWQAPTDLAKKYDGFKYSIAPLKQVVETIMVFQKPYKSGSCLHDVLAYENGDETVTCGALDIDGNRVGTVGFTKKDSYKHLKKDENYHSTDRRNFNKALNVGTIEVNENGRFPSQAFVSPETAEILDKQSGVSVSSGGNSGVLNNKVYGSFDTQKNNNGTGYNDTAGASKILHKCEFETADFDLFIYEPKVSSSERNAGCEFMEQKKGGSMNANASEVMQLGGASLKNEHKEIQLTGNNHPTLKPIDLNYKIGKLFKTPNPQTVLVPFSGAGSELIGLFKAGFETIKGCELNPEFVEISKARVRHHCTDLFNPNPLEK
jgi:site-specific DNA-methyltransferase (adenine-specific)